MCLFVCVRLHMCLIGRGFGWLLTCSCACARDFCLFVCMCGFICVVARLRAYVCVPARLFACLLVCLRVSVCSRLCVVV